MCSPIYEAPRWYPSLPVLRKRLAVAVGRAAWLVERGVELPDGAREALAAFEADGATAVVLAVAADDGDRPGARPDGGDRPGAARGGSALRAEAVLAVRDTIRPPARRQSAPPSPL